jgi:hypothetical protein
MATSRSSMRRGTLMPLISRHRRQRLWFSSTAMRYVHSLTMHVFSH